MAHYYSICGLGVQTPYPVPGLMETKPIKPADMIVQPGISDQKPNADDPTLSVYESEPDEDGNYLQVWESADRSRYHFMYRDGARFAVDKSGSRVRVHRPDSLTEDDMATYLFGPILGFVLRIKGMVCLHASAISINNSAVAFMGPPGYGKSTLAAAFAIMGFPVITDDILTLTDQGDHFTVQPGDPRLRLWPSSVGILFGAADALPRITPLHPTWDKCYLDLTGKGYRFLTDPVPLTAVYIGTHDQNADRPTIKPLDLPVGLCALIANSYACNFLNKTMRRHEFNELSRLVHTVSLRAVHVRERKEVKTTTLCRMILDDVQALSRAEQE